jgi:hypothetical protein
MKHTRHMQVVLKAYMYVPYMLEAYRVYACMLVYALKHTVGVEYMPSVGGIQCMPEYMLESIYMPH